MDKKGFAISVVLYTMVILIIGIFYLLLGIVRHRYTVGDDLKDTIINNIDPGGPPIGNVLADIVEYNYDLTSPDDYETQYIYGEIDDNYVWYSGKLWRIVCLNNDKSITLVTQGNVTSLAWNVSSTDTNYSTSQIHTWLNDEFFPTLENADILLSDSKWDYTTYTTLPPTKQNTKKYVENEKVGLLTIYDYYMAGGNSSFNYLNNNYYWWTMSPKTAGTEVWEVNRDGISASDAPNYSYGIRPCIKIKPGVEVNGGNGSITKPYTILGDKETGIASELLSNRISGEYIKFNNVLYRIVGIEEIEGKKLTKITMADYSINENTLTPSLAFGADNTERIYNSTYGIGLYLENWYQADSKSETYATNYIYDVYKNMIATANEDGINWYTSTTSGDEMDYTLSKTGTPVSATIGLGYYGEMFASQFGSGSDYSIGFWLMTSRIGWQTYSITEYCGAIPKTDVGSYRGVRPFFYLKEDVKITTGSGMPHNPYNLSQN